MVHLSLGRILAIGFAYIVVAGILVLRAERATLRAAQNAYLETQHPPPGRSYLVAVGFPWWHVAIVILPPLILVAYWLLAHASA